jgi:broad specificity phosphatase PhoE
MATCVRALAAAHPGETLLLVSHGGPIDAVLPVLDGGLPRTRKVDFTSLSLLREDEESANGFTCLIHSCSSHILNVQEDDLAR